MITKVISFLEGNLKMLGDKFNLLPEYKKEQILYRLEVCKDSCVPTGKCKECGCSLPGKMYNRSSCNLGKKFPDLMSLDNWNKFKKEKKITINV